MKNKSKSFENDSDILLSISVLTSMFIHIKCPVPVEKGLPEVDGFRP